MGKAHFSFKDYKVLYSVKVIELDYKANYFKEEQNDEKTDPNYWPQFLEQPGVKPRVVLSWLHRESIDNLLDRLSKAFSSAVLPNSFKIVFAGNEDPLTEFRETNNTSGEILELKEGISAEFRNSKLCDEVTNYMLERSSI
ncbi:hypothetical protein DdX_20516 [Ditylenchus destructor]|uniref:Uncharacterized protein n=1 Tax=Ditylenchus destructor TaxID=166010 RepID=A0AAD4MH46_9BILA|nr:hypothetical protein DdX_20516 [Ditylenchus destructor]